MADGVERRIDISASFTIAAVQRKQYATKPSLKAVLKLPNMGKFMNQPNEIATLSQTEIRRAVAARKKYAV